MAISCCDRTIVGRQSGSASLSFAAEGHAGPAGHEAGPSTHELQQAHRASCSNQIPDNLTVRACASLAQALGALVKVLKEEAQRARRPSEAAAAPAPPVKPWQSIF